MSQIVLVQSEADAGLALVVTGYTPTSTVHHIYRKPGTYAVKVDSALEIREPSGDVVAIYFGHWSVRLARHHANGGQQDGRP